uniref:complement component C1q receptor-like n=1 Tax=Myxine glutinosa TaxID=7769 RepID=UPI00358E2F18
MIITLFLGFVYLGRSSGHPDIIESLRCSESTCFGVRYGNDSKITFQEARNYCSSTGGHLASIRSEVEAHLVSRLIEDAGIQAKKGVAFWIGLRKPRGLCTVTHKALRGYHWTSGEGDTPYANWVATPERTCTRVTCVSLVYAHTGKTPKWKGRNCRTSRLVGTLCEYKFEAMCAPIAVDQGSMIQVHYASVLPVQGDGSRALLPGTVANVTCLDLPRPQSAEISCSQDVENDQKADWSHSDLPCLQKRCEHGYELHGDVCQDMDECDEEPCEHIGFCSNTAGSFVCECLDGYTVVNTTGCADVDECQFEPCDYRCLNTDGSFECLCSGGYRQHKNGLECEDIDECERGDHNCAHQCINIEGSYECTCDEGYVLREDQLACVLMLDPENIQDPTKNEDNDRQMSDPLVPGATTRSRPLRSTSPVLPSSPRFRSVSPSPSRASVIFTMPTGPPSMGNHNSMALLIAALVLAPLLAITFVICALALCCTRSSAKKDVRADCLHNGNNYLLTNCSQSGPTKTTIEGSASTQCSGSPTGGTTQTGSEDLYNAERAGCA